MFGVAVARLDQVSPSEKERYQAFYCGVCRAIRQRYGQVSRATLSYDLAFLAIFLDALSEAPQEEGVARCPAHPMQPMPYLRSDRIDYAADLSVAFAYHKVLDDVADEGTIRAHAAEQALRNAYVKAVERVPEECAVIEACMRRIRVLEEASDAPPDACAQAFGECMARIFASQAGMWAQESAVFGFHVGRLVYLMDAAIDLPSDRVSGSYNPFTNMDMDDAQQRRLLGSVAADAADAFERLPIVQDAQLLRAVLYAGVWQKLDQAREAEAKRAKREGRG